MYGMKLLLLTIILAALEKAYSESPLSGKCKTNNLNSINLDSELVPGKWIILYLSNLDDDSELDHVYFTVTPTRKNAYNIVRTKVLKNGRPLIRYVTLTFNKNVFISEFVDDDKTSEYKWHPLAKTREGAILFYHCSDTGVFPMDVRFIAIPDGRNVANYSLQQLFDVDKSFIFTGNLYKLSNKLNKIGT